MMVKAGKTAGMSALALSIGAMGVLGVNSLVLANTTSPASTVSVSTAASSTTSPGYGCAANHASIPVGANQVTTVDLDGDGRADTLWNSGERFGVRTASGATFSAPFSNAGGPDVSVELLTLSGASKVIMEVGRFAFVNAVVDCKIVATKDKQGGHYTFDQGFLHPGASWTFTKIKGKKQLVGLQLTTISTKDGLYGVDETPIVLHKHGRTATNGKIRKLRHNGHVYMSKSTATKLIASLVKAGKPTTVVTSPGD